MITRKAAVGFVLLAIIVFSISSYDAANPANKKGTPEITGDSPIQIRSNGLNNIPDVRNDTIIYRKPAMDFGSNTPLAMTAIIELFALVCYLAAKRIEPAVKEWEARERERVRQEQEDPEESEDQEDSD